MVVDWSQIIFSSADVAMESRREVTFSRADATDAATNGVSSISIVDY
jgi:hypothetical protein